MLCVLKLWWQKRKELTEADKKMKILFNSVTSFLFCPALVIISYENYYSMIVFHVIKEAKVFALGTTDQCKNLMLPKTKITQTLLTVLAYFSSQT